MRTSEVYIENSTKVLEQCCIDPCFLPMCDDPLPKDDIVQPLFEAHSLPHTHTLSHQQELPLPLKWSLVQGRRSNSGSFSLSYWPTARASHVSSGPISETGNSKSSTPRRSPAAGGNEKTNPRWTMRSSAEVCGTTTTRTSSRKCRISDTCIGSCATLSHFWVSPSRSYRRLWTQVESMEQLSQLRRS